MTTVFLFTRFNKALYIVRDMNGDIIFKGTAADYIKWRKAHSSYEVIK